MELTDAVLSALALLVCLMLVATALSLFVVLPPGGAEGPRDWDW